jgi:hypothetical protein
VVAKPEGFGLLGRLGRKGNFKPQESSKVVERPRDRSLTAARQSRRYAGFRRRNSAANSAALSP